MLVAAPMMPSWFWVRLGSITDPVAGRVRLRQARKDLMWEGWQTFVEHPLTGVGAGQFKNYNPPDRLRALARNAQRAAADRAPSSASSDCWRFSCCSGRRARSLLWTRRMFGTARAHRETDHGAGTLPVTEAFRPDEREWMRMHAVAMSASLVGWLVCAQFASVGYYWTFYYLFALIVAGRELTSDRIVAAHRRRQPARRRPPGRSCARA